jgi:NDP-sugar pyrophosphorylase family protein
LTEKLTTAMILAAGFGTRLKPLTLTAPKALVKINGTPMIKLVLDKLICQGIDEVIVNAHHFSGQIEKYFEDNDFGIRIHIIREERILGTGGGIKNAEKFLKNSECFLVHNVDVLCDLNIQDMLEYHQYHQPLATLAVKKRNTSRPLLIDEQMNIIGRSSPGDNDAAVEKTFQYTNPVGEVSKIGFCGVHIISSEIFSSFTEEGFFDIFITYFQLIKEKKKIVGYNIGEAYWKDLGAYLPIQDSLES